MFKDKLFRNNLFLVILAFLVIITLYSASIISYRNFYSIMLPGVFTTIGFIIAVIFLHIAEKKNSEAFIGAVFMGMGIRLLFLLVLIALSFKFLDINKNSFIFSVLIFYIYYLTIEIIYTSIRNK
jgi:hypothetical protein